MMNKYFIKHIQEQGGEVKEFEGKLWVTGCMDVKFETEVELPVPVVFHNDGDIIMRCKSMPDGMEFHNKGSVQLRGLTTLGSAIFRNTDLVTSLSVSEIAYRVRFSNAGGVYMPNLKKIDPHTSFRNSGGVGLSRIEQLPEGLEFFNRGSIGLDKLKQLPQDIRFNNGSIVFLGSISGPVEYQDQTIDIRKVDGMTMIVESEKKVGNNIRLIRGRYFEGKAIADMPQVYVAKRADLCAHGKTAEQAIRDLEFKYNQRFTDVSGLAKKVRTSGRVSLMDYRLLTGSCEEGCKKFMENNNLDPEAEDYPLDEILKLTKDAYGGQKFASLVKSG